MPEQLPSMGGSPTLTDSTIKRFEKLEGILRSPLASALTGAILFLGLIGLFRAIAEYGHAGFVAFLGVLFWPVLVVASAIVIGPHFNNGLLGGLIPSTSTFRRLAYAVVIAGVLGAAFTGLLGVGWLVNP